MDRRNFLKALGGTTAYFFAPVGGWPRRTYSFKDVNGIFRPQIVDVLMAGSVWIDGKIITRKSGDKPIVLPPSVQYYCLDTVVKQFFENEEGYRL